MLLKIADWEFDIDLEATMAYSAAEAATHCDCAYCRNFYAAVDIACPEARPFLTRFGLDIEAPEELMPFDDGTYDVTYAVCGRILHRGGALYVSGVPVYPDTDTNVNVACPSPFFVLNIGLLRLPWVLDEPFDEVVSPANTPSFLKKMWNKLLGRAEDTLKQ